MAVNVFSNPINGPASITNRGTIAADVELTANSTEIQRMDVGATDRKIQLPNPALCLDRVFEISNISSTNTLAVHQYNATAFTGAVIALPNGGVTGTLKSVTSAVGANNATYTSARYFCDGTTWILLSANCNFYFA